MFRVAAIFMVIASVCSVQAAASLAQEPSDPPKPAMSADAGPSTPVLDVPDTRPLAGAQDLTLGSSSDHSFLMPSFGVTTQAQFNPSSPTAPGSPSSTESSTFLSGRLAVNKISPHSELLLDYLASGGFSTYSSQSSSVIQNLEFSETFRVGRWALLFGEAFSYLPGSSYNFSGLGGLDNLGVNLGSVGTSSSFRQNLLPNQSIFQRGSARISSSTIAQTTYLLSYRSSITFFAAYGPLHFIEAGLRDNSFLNTGAGYNYLLSPSNSVSVSYVYSRFGFSGLPPTQTHSTQVSLARRVTGRLSLQVGAGPEVQLFDVSLPGPHNVVSWNVNGALIYQIRNWGMRGSYSHGLTGGAGVFAGAETDTLSGHLSRGFGSWQVSVTGGYARNHTLQQTSPLSLAPQGWFASAQTGRRLARFGSIFAAYNAYGQSGLTAVCSTAVCGTGGVTHTVSIGYNWSLRPITLE